MKLNFQALAKLRSAWHTFRDNHPNIVPFLRDVVKKGIREDMQFEVIVHYPDGTDMRSGIRLKQSDVALFEALQELL